VNHAQLLQGSLVRGALPVTPTASNLRFSDRPVSAAAIPRNETGGGQRFFSRMPAGAAAAQRTPFAQQQAAVRSAFGGAGREPFSGGGAQSQAAGSGWRRFGEPSQPQSRGFQSTGGANSGGAGAGWDRFGSPQRSATPPPATQQQGQYSRPPVYYGSGSGQSRAVQVAPPIVQQRSAPAPESSYRSAPQSGNRGGNGGGHSSGGHGGGHR
jgi:hypothetical protein